jgi:hypothetical protein
MATTLIFAKEYSVDERSRIQLETVFVKEGSFAEAMAHYDDKYPVFKRKGRYVFGDGTVICTEQELTTKQCLKANVTDWLLESYYTVASDQLDRNELLAVADRLGFNAAGYWEENGFTAESYQSAYINRELGLLLDLGSKDYMDRE